MARRKNKNEIEVATVGRAILVLVAIAFAVRFITAIGVGVLIVGILLIVIFAAMVFYFVQKRAARLASLRAKYGDETLVQRIMRRQYWQGQTVEQLRDSLGPPASVDKNLLKARKREVWKYHANGVNRYRLRITLDNDVVIGFGHRDQEN